MKVAIVHELLTRRGGAERVAKVLADMFPKAPIYTLLYNEKKLSDWFPKERVHVPNFQFSIFNFQFLYKYNHHLLLRQFPAMTEQWDFTDYDIVISSSSAFAHGIITNGKTKHICYVHSPARYLWDATHEVLDRAARGPLGFLKRKYLEHTFHKLRIWDAEVAPRADVLIANSKEVQRRIELYWRRDSQVIHPPIDPFWFENPKPKTQNPKPYFLIVSTLTPYKNIEIAIQACNKLQLPLKIVGEGPDAKRLQSLAGKTVEFLGYKPSTDVQKLYTEASAVLFPGADDFGMVPVEAMACGTPVIALRKGGALETVIENQTGLFFDEPTTESLQSTLSSFDANAFDSTMCREHAKQFSQQLFEQQIREIFTSI
ncbi:MAG: glycosyltransferase [bacterium]|nr:glycosyltransferase [bacterium]